MIILAAVAIVFGVLRFVLPVEGKINKADIYKDLAHLFVGGVFGAGLGTGEAGYFWIAGVLSVLEVVAFNVRKK